MKGLKRILIIEDDPLNRELERALFEMAGYTVFEAGDARKGIAIAKNEQPDVIIMDFQLPGMNGIQAIEVLKNDPKTHNIPCIIVTSTATERELEMFKSPDICGYITKPLNTRTFVKEVVGLARNYQLASEHAQ